MDNFCKATPAQQKILDVLSSLKPYERVEIVADKDGKPDSYLVQRSTKFMLIGQFTTYIK